MAILALTSVSILGLCACSQNSPAANSQGANTSSLEVSDKTPESLPPTQGEIEKAALKKQQKIESAIIDHKEWRSGNSDTSEAFADYLANYKSIRKHA